MLHVYDKNKKQVISCDKELLKNCWFNLIDPIKDEIKTVSLINNIPEDVLSTSLDLEERSRIETDDDYLLVVVNLPVMEDDKTFDTLPLGIILNKDNIITVCSKENVIINWLKNNPKKIDTTDRVAFLYTILYNIAVMFLKYLRYINKYTDKVETEVRESIKNKAFYNILEIGKGLVYFTSALKDNGIVLNRLMRMNKKNPFLDDSESHQEILEDVIIENQQASEMVEMHSNILNSMMDAYASIVSNNLNMVMRFLTMVTILLAIPTMVASFWGMNVKVPFANSAHGFWIVVSIGFIVTLVSMILLNRKQKLT